LQHNRTLRLDRIPDAAISTIKGKWRRELDYLEVEMHLLKGLAFAYEAKTSDILNEWLSDRPSADSSGRTPPVKRVIRRVSSTFWFFREIFRYGEDCIIVSPESIQQRFKQKLQDLCKAYRLLQ